jgi:cyclophilin family peptidyl-prolyl cis-trans isomerase
MTMKSHHMIRATFFAMALLATAVTAQAQGGGGGRRPPPQVADPLTTNVGALAGRENPAPIAPEGVLNNPEHMLALDLSTGGRVVIQLRPDVAPNHVERIKTLTRQGFYNGLLFHRVIDGFMAQGGDPLGNGTGGSPLPPLAQEFNGLPHVRGTLSMARSSEPDSANSQFFIMMMPRLTLDRNYTVFGRVVSGIDFVDRIQRGEPPANPSRIVQASILADNRPMPPASQLVETVAAPAAAPVTATDLNAPLAPPR